MLPPKPLAQKKVNYDPRKVQVHDTSPEMFDKPTYWQSKTTAQ